MTLTNNLSLPQPVVIAIQSAQDNYNKGECDFSTTELIAPPRITQLAQRNEGKLTEDASDRIFSLIGVAIHSILESSAWQGYEIETRYFMDFAGTRISGKIDLYHWGSKTLFDYKITSYHAVSDGPKREWVEQANINRLILEANEIAVEKMENVCIFRDWSKMMAIKRNDYPDQQVQTFKIPIWPRKQAEEFLEYRIRAHQEARQALHLPLCTPEERWQDPERYAVIKKGAKRAKKLYDSIEEAQRAANGNEELTVETRPSEAKRCLFYCPVTRFCDFGRELLREACGQ